MKKSDMQMITLGLLAILVLLLVVNQIFLMNIGSAMTKVSLSAAAVGIVSSQTSYGIALDNNGYKQLVGFDKSIRLSSNESAQIYDAIIGRDKNNQPYISHPCCTAAISECDCGHAVALRGLVKYLLEEGYSPTEIIEETAKWNALFFPQQEQNSGLGGC
jgi:hypothetical protein